MVSRQRRWQIKQAKLGNCIICGKKAVRQAMCEFDARKDSILHRETNRVRNRRVRRFFGAKSYQDGYLKIE